jgi:hypothetical protein
LKFDGEINNNPFSQEGIRKDNCLEGTFSHETIGLFDGS